MSLLDRVSRLVTGGEADASREAVAALSEAYVGCVQRSRQLLRHAELAPQAYSSEGLKELAAMEEEQGRQLRDALVSAGAAIPSIRADGDLEGGPNHWARLVHDLEAHRASTQQLRLLSMRFSESLPQTGNLFAQLCTVEQQHCERLRALIARADPQALD